MDARQWHYVGEGGRHALFASKDLPGKVLRLDKQDLARACSESQIAAREEGHQGISRKSQQGFLARFLVPYVDPPDVIKLSWSFVCGLRNQSINQGKIPTLRKKDWISESQATSGPPHCEGQLLRDYRTPRSPIENACESISIEIKPKAGYSTVSPFVDPRRRAKYNYSRFVLNQHLYRAKKLRKSWMKNNEADCSNYDPYDLYSMDKPRMEHAVQAMIASPQNNFQIWSNNRKILYGFDGDGIPSFDTSCLSEVFNMTSTQNLGDEIAQRQLVNALVTVLSHEPYLTQTLQLQKLDVIDGDGALLLFDHLVDMVGDDVSACSLIDDFLLDSAYETSRHSLMIHTPFATPENHENLFCLLNDIEQFKNQLHAEKIPDTQSLDDARIRCMESLKRLSVEESRYLLQNWLLSLTVSDISFFVTLRRLNDVSHPCCDGVATNNLNRWTVIRCQTDNPGVVYFDGGSSTIFLEYEIKAIDFELKPAEKLRSRGRKEELLNDLQVVRKS